ncbi:DASH family cryptochrome [Pleomorphovibrio marinus]|uniref:DASH family cryptochrome n=1 Tax=Pleomorphovibrio marinus TaxID=2164132 RepID=UPI000E0B42C6|nr:DASH family cryptochrome [Pleomorphovibrio marinus]
MPQNTALLWLRNDLRVHDHAALTGALENANYLLPVYCFDPRHFADTELGIPKTGGFRAKFLIECLEDLQRTLKAKGADLIVLQGYPEIKVPEFAEQVGATTIYFSKEVTQEEIKVEETLEERAWAQGIRTESYWQATLYQLDALPFPINQLPEVFTVFRKECEKMGEIKKMLPEPEHVPFPKEQTFPCTLPALEALIGPPPKKDKKAAMDFVGGENRALERLSHYFWETKSLASYKTTRNGLLGADFSSKFSPWLALGALSPRKIYWEIKKFETEETKNSSTYWLFFELVWRDFFRFAAKKHGNRFFQVEGISNQSRVWSSDKSQFEQWTQGNTGIPMIDANMRELNATGYMSNRGRQLVASFLTHDLGIDWRWGASYFESRLIDYDVCSNWGNWMYVAGVGHDPRQNRYFNILNQAKKYDKDGDFVRHWLPKLKKLEGFDAHQPFAFTDKEKAVRMGGNSYPKPMVDVSKW